MGIKEGDWVVVQGEANECFKVTKVDKNYVSLHTGWREPIEKCTMVPESKVIKTTKYYCDIYPGTD